MCTALEAPPFTVEDVHDLQADVRDRPSKLDQVAHLHEHYPHLGWAWISKRIGALLSMDPEQLVSIIGYPDPTGETAARNVDLERQL